jgi:hypothetical protein
MSEHVRLHDALVLALTRLHLVSSDERIMLTAAPLESHVALSLASQWPDSKVIELNLDESLARRESGAWVYCGVAVTSSRSATLDELIRQIGDALAECLTPWFERATVRRVITAFRRQNRAAVWRSARVSSNGWSAHVRLTIDARTVLGELVLSRRGRSSIFVLFRTPATSGTLWLPLLGSLEANRSAVWVTARSADLLPLPKKGAKAEVFHTGSGPNTRRFLVTTLGEKPNLAQKWQLTKRGRPVEGTHLETTWPAAALRRTVEAAKARRREAANRRALRQGPASAKRRRV